MGNPLTFVTEQKDTDVTLARDEREVSEPENNNGTSVFPASEPTSAELLTTSSNSSTPFVTSQTNWTTMDNGTTFVAASSTPMHTGDDGDKGAGTAIAIIITLVLAVAFVAVVFFFLKKKGKLPCFLYTRARRSSTSSSRRALGDHEITEHAHDPSNKPRRGEQDDMFTIDDFDDPDPNEPREEYYYDEVFGQSQFEDEATNTAMRTLYSENGEEKDEEEMLDFDFETLGIKIDDYKLDPVRKNTV